MNKNQERVLCINYKMQYAYCMDYKPHIPTDKTYIEKIKNSISIKNPLEEILFHLLIAVLSDVDIHDNPYNYITATDLNSDKIKTVSQEAFKKINTTPLNEITKQKLYKLWDYLCEADQLEKADLIFVFGGGGVTRPIYASELYKQGWAPKVLFTGEGPSYTKDVSETEAEKFAKIAIEHGVLVWDILIEKEAKNTPENVMKSIALLRTFHISPKRIIAVQIEYQMKRAYLTLRGGFGGGIHIIRQPARSARFNRENYFTNPDGWTYVFFEYIKMYAARLMKHF